MPLDESGLPFLVKRSALFKINQLEQMEEAAMRILEEIGIAVPDDDLLEQISSCGFPIRGNRVFIHRKLFKEFLEAERDRNGNAFSEEPLPVEVRSSQVHLSMLTYPQNIHALYSSIFKNRETFSQAGVPILDVGKTFLTVASNKFYHFIQQPITSF